MAKGALIKISGQVQGVGLRYTVYQYAQENRLNGWVRNEPDGTIGCFLQNSEAEIEKFLNWLKKEFVGIIDIKIIWSDAHENLENFEVRY